MISETQKLQSRLAALDARIKRRIAWSFVTLTLWPDRIAGNMHGFASTGSSDTMIEGKTLHEVMCAMEDAVDEYERRTQKVAETLGIEAS